MNWIDRIPWAFLVVIAIWMALVPFGQPHLVEKWRMLAAGTLRRPLDWFDLLMHSAPIALLLIKMVRLLMQRNAA